LAEKQPHIFCVIANAVKQSHVYIDEIASSVRQPANSLAMTLVGILVMTVVGIFVMTVYFLILLNRKAKSQTATTSITFQIIKPAIKVANVIMFRPKAISE